MALVDIPNKQDRDIIDWIIKEYKVEHGCGGSIDGRDDIVAKIKENKDMISKWSEQGC